MIAAAILFAFAAIPAAIFGLSPDVSNLILNIGTILAVLFLAPRAFKAHVAKAELAEKDRAISTHSQTIEALRERDRARDDDVAYLRKKVTDTETKVEDAMAEAALYRGKYMEIEKYTAGPALAALVELLERQEREQERRHTETMAVLQKLAPNGSSGH